MNTKYPADGIQGGAHAANISSNLGLGLPLSHPGFVDEETAVRFNDSVDIILCT